jgi:hypothetical protein
VKKVVSIPDELFEKAERLARRTKASDEVTEAMDRVYAELGNNKDEFVSSAAQRVLDRNEW